MLFTDNAPPNSVNVAVLVLSFILAITGWDIVGAVDPTKFPLPDAPVKPFPVAFIVAIINP
jgi:hypothetical protein